MTDHHRNGGVIVAASSAKDFAQAMNDEFEMYRKIVKDAGIKPE